MTYPNDICASHTQLNPNYGNEDMTVDTKQCLRAALNKSITALISQ